MAAIHRNPPRLMTSSPLPSSSLPHRHALLALALAYGLAMFSGFAVEWHANFPGVYSLYDDRTRYGIDTLLVMLLLSLALACITQYTGRVQRLVFSLLFTLLTLNSFVATAHAKLYAAPVSVGAIDALLGTDLHEAGEFLRFQFSVSLCLILAGFVGLLVWGLGWLRPRLWIHPVCFRTHLIAGALVAGLTWFSYGHPAFSAAKQNEPWLQPFGTRFNILNNQIPALRMMMNVAEWLDYRQWLRDSQEKRAQYDYRATLGNEAPATLVLVIGESMRRGNASLYGYDKPTTPLMQQRLSHLLLFRQAIAPANQTIPSITKILTPATVLNPDLFLERPSIIGAARQAGYKTFWLSNQGRVGNFDSMISLFAREAEQTVYTNTEFYAGTYDNILLPPLQEALADPAPHKLIVLHLQGSHQDYRKRYPPEFARFSASQYPPNSALKKAHDSKRREALASYDNSILYNDWLLDQILTLLDQHPGSLALYLSDHGQRFFENGVPSAGHGYPEPTRNEVEVPYWIWCQANCPARWQQAHTRHRQTPFSTEHLFYTLLGMLDINTPDYRPDRKSVV